MAPTVDVPAVQCIIPTFRRPTFLVQALQSVRRQTYPNLSILVLDNASGDETERVVNEMVANDGRITYHRHARNLGAKGNFLYGLHQVKTPYFCLLSDDDLLLSRFIEKAYEGFLKHPDALFSALSTLNIDEAGRVWGLTGGDWPAGYYSGAEGREAFCRYGHPIWTGVLFARAALPDFARLIEPWDVISDLAIELSLAIRGSFVVDPVPGAAFRSHATSISQTSERQIVTQTAAMIDAVAGEAGLAPGEALRLARAAKEILGRTTVGLWPRYIIENDSVAPALGFIRWLRRDIGLDTAKTRRLERIFRLVSAPPLFRAFRSLCIRRYPGGRRSAPDPRLATYETLLRA